MLKAMKYINLVYMKPLNVLSNLHIFHISHNSLQISHAGC